MSHEALVLTEPNNAGGLAAFARAVLTFAPARVPAMHFGAPLARYTAEAIEETLSEVPLGDSSIWLSSARRARIDAAFDQLNSRYREVIDAYPCCSPARPTA